MWRRMAKGRVSGREVRGKSKFRKRRIRVEKMKIRGETRDVKGG